MRSDLMAFGVVLVASAFTLAWLGLAVWQEVTRTVAQWRVRRELQRMAREHEEEQRDWRATWGGDY